MKVKLIKFFSLIAIVIAIGLFAIGYYEVSKLQSNIFESKAIIAQAQPLIQVAKGQRAIDNAIAYQVIAVSTSQVILAIVPYIVAIAYLSYKYINKEAKQKIQDTVNVVYDERVQNN